MSAFVIHELSTNSTYLSDHSSAPRGIRTLMMVSREAVGHTGTLILVLNLSRCHHFLSVSGKFLLCSYLMPFSLGQVGIIEPLSWFATADRFPGLVSPFDEKLTEDRRVNRLEDSFLLWKSVCSCKLLTEAQLILCKFFSLSCAIY